MTERFDCAQVIPNGFDPGHLETRSRHSSSLTRLIISNFTYTDFVYARTFMPERLLLTVLLFRLYADPSKSSDISSIKPKCFPPCATAAPPKREQRKKKKVLCARKRERERRSRIAKIFAREQARFYFPTTVYPRWAAQLDILMADVMRRRRFNLRSLSM